MLKHFLSEISRLNNPMIYDNSMLMAIIAINMTVIGLTSLADVKCVIGVDYGSKELISNHLLGPLGCNFYHKFNKKQSTWIK